MNINFAFWNTNRKKCLVEINNIIAAYNIDILILAENTANEDEILFNLNSKNSDFHPNHPNSLCEKLKIYSKFHYDFIEPFEESHRYSVRNLALPVLPNMNLICLHFGDKSNFNPESQSEMASEMNQFISMVETKSGHNRTIIIGDFNMNPFEVGMIKANGFHATMSHKLAKEEKRKVQFSEYDYFYNPMWGLFGDIANDPCGTYYYRNAELVNYQWNIFDQILLRPSIADNLDKKSIKIITNDGSKNLITKKGIPNKQLYSDHLPITFTLTF